MASVNVFTRDTGHSLLSNGFYYGIMNAEGKEVLPTIYSYDVASKLMSGKYELVIRYSDDKLLIKDKETGICTIEERMTVKTKGSVKGTDKFGRKFIVEEDGSFSYEPILRR